MGTFTINTRLLPVKIHYFLFNAALSAVIPFIPVYGKQLGVTAFAMGVIYTVLPFLSLIGKPLFGAIADYTQKLKHILIILLCIVIVTMLGLCFIPPPYNSGGSSPIGAKKELFCWQNSSYLITVVRDNCNLDVVNDTNRCSASCVLCQEISGACLNESFRNNTLESNKPPFEVAFNGTRELIARCTNTSAITCNESCYNGLNDCDGFNNGTSNPPLQLWLFSILITVSWTAFVVSSSLSDSACYNSLGPQPQLFGKQRLWGTVGWGIFAALAGYMNQIATRSSGLIDFSPGFYILAILTLMDLVAVKYLSMTGVKSSKTMCRDVGLLLVKPRVLMFLLGVFFIGMFTGLCRVYLFWYLSSLDASQFNMGLASAVQCFLGELPFFFFAGWIIEKIGQIHTITAAFVAYALRFLLYSYLTNPWWVLPVEILQGPCFGAFYAAMTSYAKVIAPLGTEATMQGLVGGTFEGLGAAAGCLLGGFVFDFFGGSTTFFWFGIMAILGALCHASATICHFLIKAF